MKVELVGIGVLDYTSKKTGQPVQGINLYINYLDPNVMGKVADNKYLSKDLCDQIGITADSLAPYIFKEVELELNLRGYVIGVKPVAKST